MPVLCSPGSWDGFVQVCSRTAPSTQPLCLPAGACSPRLSSLILEKPPVTAITVAQTRVAPSEPSQKSFLHDSRRDEPLCNRPLQYLSQGGLFHMQPNPVFSSLKKTF